MNTKCIFTFLILCCALMVTQNSFAGTPVKGNPPVERKADFDNNWHFHLGDVPEAEEPAFDDASWRRLNLPHDWSIEGTFSKDNPAGVGGGALPGGIGWYRKVFTIPETEEGKLFFIDFDGVYMDSKVWINGHYLGVRPYGYSSFQYDMTPYLHYGKEKNVIAVRVDNSKQPNSRWYSGSGINRNVWLVTTNKVHIGHWGTYVSTPEVNDQRATVSMQTTVVNGDVSSKNITLKTTIFNDQGKVVAEKSISGNIESDSSKTFSQTLIVERPELWSTERPTLYKVISTVENNGKETDRYETPLGIRTFRFDAKDGFFLNGKHLQIRGVCDHENYGCLGSAENYRAIQRQLQMLKSMGVNAIRTSHNPPTPDLLELADKMGIMVMDEAFDCWQRGKNPYDYHLYWKQWHRRDLSDMIRRDRNHPSIIIWSIGNEIPDQWDSAGGPIARELAGIVRSLDTTRPITSALNNPPGEGFNSVFSSGALDLIGLNYHDNLYPTFEEKFPNLKFIATETTSALETRGEYDMPSDSIRVWPEKGVAMNANYTCSAYDNCRVPWGATHEQELKAFMKNKFVSGIFIWTGFDYLGEPTPYGWPARSSYFGIIDLAGFPKDAYYLYKSVWTDKPTLHIFPDWNWQAGDTVDVWAYYNDADKVDLFLNGKSLGSRSKEGDDLHVMWRVPYQPGTLKAISYKDGKVVLTKEIHTAGSAARMVIEPDRRHIQADGKDLSFVTIKIVDKEGNLVPHADNLIRFKISGQGFIAGMDNGDEIDHESFQGDQHKAYNGLCLAVIQSNGKEGKITLTASSDGLQTASTVLEAGR